MQYCILCFWFGSFFSTYLQDKNPFLCTNNRGSIAGGIRGFIPFLVGISPKVKVNALMEFEPAY